MPTRWSDFHSLECFSCTIITTSMVIELINPTCMKVCILWVLPFLSLSVPLQVHLQVPFWVRQESSVRPVNSELRYKEIPNCNRKFTWLLYHLLGLFPSRHSWIKLSSFYVTEWLRVRVQCRFQIHCSTSCALWTKLLNLFTLSVKQEL